MLHLQKFCIATLLLQQFFMGSSRHDLPFMKNNYLVTVANCRQSVGNNYGCMEYNVCAAISLSLLLCLVEAQDNARQQQHKKRTIQQTVVHHSTFPLFFAPLSSGVDGEHKCKLPIIGHAKVPCFAISIVLVRWGNRER